MQLPKTIFRNYDIRGIYPTELNEDGIFRIGKALGSVLHKRQEQKVVVGRDDRESSPSLTESLIKGLVETGCYVTDVGITVTPAIHFLTVTEGFNLGLCVTASHNPKDYNGLRLDYKNARSFYGDLIQMVRYMIDRGIFHYEEGTVVEEDLTQKYIDYLASKFEFKNHHKVVIDCGSGATSVVAPKLLEKLGCEVVPVYCDINPAFPHGVPDPENTLFVEELRGHVMKVGADVGFAFDTDGDRFGFVDENGSSYRTDETLMLFAQDVLKKNPESTIVYDVKSTNLLEKQIKKMSGIPKLIRTGHPYFTQETAKGALLGAEFSGHVYFADDYFGYDDGIYAACKTIQILDKTGKKLSELMSQFPKNVSTNEIKVNCPDEFKFKVVNILKIYMINFVDYKTLKDIDGIRVETSDTGWFLIRASNTSPYLSMRAEGKDKEELDNLLDIMRKAIESVNIVELDVNF